MMDCSLFYDSDSALFGWFIINIWHLTNRQPELISEALHIIEHVTYPFKGMVNYGY